MITYLKKIDLNAVRGFYMGRAYPIHTSGGKFCLIGALESL